MGGLGRVEGFGVGFRVWRLGIGPRVSFHEGAETLLLASRAGSGIIEACFFWWLQNGV